MKQGKIDRPIFLVSVKTVIYPVTDFGMQKFCHIYVCVSRPKFLHINRAEYFQKMHTKSESAHFNTRICKMYQKYKCDITFTLPKDVSG